MKIEALPRWVFAFAAGVVAVVLFLAFIVPGRGVELGKLGKIALIPEAQISPSELFDRYMQRAWSNETANRELNEDYTNALPYPIDLSVGVSGLTGTSGSSNPCDLQVWVGGELIAQPRDNSEYWARICATAVTIPPGAEYEVVAKASKNNGGRLVYWMELR